MLVETFLASSIIRYLDIELGFAGTILNSIPFLATTSRRHPWYHDKATCAREGGTALKRILGNDSGDFVLICSTDNDRSATGWIWQKGVKARGARGGYIGLAWARRWPPTRDDEKGEGWFQTDWLAWQKLPKSEARYVQHANTRLEIIFVINCTS